MVIDHPIRSMVFCFLLSSACFGTLSRGKDQRKLAEPKQKKLLIEDKGSEESIQNYRRLMLNDARAMAMLLPPFAILEMYTLLERLDTSAHPNSGLLPYLDDPRSIAGTPSEVLVQASTPSQADVLLVTVTEVETKAVLHVFAHKYQQNYERRFIGFKTYYELGVVNGARTFLVQSEMGVGGIGSSLLTVYEGIRALGPSSVIMVGIAFGVDPLKQRIGDVLVSQQLHGYHLQRYGTGDDGRPEIISRGDRVTASAKLLDRFRSASLDWPSRRGRWGKQVYFGTILSGETLVDNIDYRDHLRSLEPEAIGGEMEGVGLYAAAHNAKVDWIIVKAICDWADGNKSGQMMVVSDKRKRGTRNLKDEYQRRAAHNAAQFTLHVLDKMRVV